MDKECIDGRMVDDMKADITRTKKKAMEPISGWMAVGMRESGKTANEMVQALLFMQMESKNMDFGSTTKDNP